VFGCLPSLGGGQILKVTLKLPPVSFSLLINVPLHLCTVGYGFVSDESMPTSPLPAAYDTP
jgi:hypothetical protein